MGKAKKGKKGTVDDESEDEVEVETRVGADENLAGKGKEKKIKSKVVDETPEDDENELTNKKKKGKKDKKKKRGEDDDDSAPEEVEETPLAKVKSNKKQAKKVERSKGDESSDEELEVPRSKTFKGKNVSKHVVDSDDENILPSKPKPMQSNKTQGFALLRTDSNSHSDEEEQSDDNNKSQKKKVVRSDSVDEEVNGEKTRDDKSSGKKGKKNKKKKEEDDDDIEKMLAELAIEYSGGKKEEVVVVEDVKAEPAKKVKTKGKDSIKDSIVTDVEKVEIIDGVELEGTIKSAAQKKKEKKEREKLKKQAQKKTEPLKKPNSTEGDAAIENAVQDEKIKSTDDVSMEPKSEEADMDDKKKKKKKGSKDVEEEKSKTKGPNKKMIAAMQEALKKVKDEEEKFAREEEERIRREEEAEKAREEAVRLEQERKEKRKQKEKEKKERLKAEGKLLTAKQKNDRARAQAMLDALKAQGLDMPNIGEKKAPRPGTRVRGKSKVQSNVEEKGVEGDKLPLNEQKVEVEIIDQEKDEEKEGLKEVEEEEETEGVKDAWDAESSGGEHDEEDVEEEKPVKAQTQPKSPAKGREKIKQKQTSQEDDDDDEGSGSSSEEESEDSEDDHKTDAERKREKALARISKRREEAEKGKTLDNLRAAVVCVLGHVDTGKTKILDKLRRTNVQDGEAGGITQQIGATNVPIDAIKEQTKIVKGFADYVMRIPGLLIIDTPGHESFSNLRSRGSSLCDIAILVVDIMHGLEPQTLESINLLKSKKTPFVVALNKIDRLYDWQTMARKDVRDVIKAQASNTQLEFEQRTKEVIVQFAEQGLNASLFYENPDIRSYVSLVPTSAITGEGIPNLLALIVDNCQNMLAKRLMYSDELQATVLEVKAISGLGTTIDAILINGKLREGDTMVLAGTDGPIVTQIRSLLMPQPMKELRVKNAYVEYKEIKAAQGVKIAAKELEKAIAGLNMQVAQKPDEVEILRDEVAKELRQALSNIKLKDRGVYVQASTLGSLEALLEFLKTSNIPYANIRIGPVVKKDVMKASTMLEHDSQYATILAFDVKIEKDAQEMADTLGVRIFQADIIYHLFDKFMAYREELRQRKREEFKHIAVFPCKLKVLPQYIFNSRDPIVMGVMVEAGIVREGTPICVPSREFVELGIIRSVEYNKKGVENARKGQEVCIKIEAIPGEAPKMFGRHFDETDFLVSKISRQSIDACKDYFRDDLIKADWELMVELKKQFEIL